MEEFEMSFSSSTFRLTKDISVGDVIAIHDRYYMIELGKVSRLTPHFIYYNLLDTHLERDENDQLLYKLFTVPLALHEQRRKRRTFMVYEPQDEYYTFFSQYRLGCYKKMKPII
jgi:hypothetical protein